jgi:hypothetical protein
VIRALEKIAELQDLAAPSALGEATAIVSL